MLTFNVGEEQHEELFAELVKHEDHDVTIERTSKALVLTCKTCSKALITIEPPSIDFSRVVQITVHGKANALDLDGEGGIERRINEQLRGGLKVDAESTVDGIEINDVEVDEVRPG